MVTRGLDKRVHYRRNKAWRTKSNKVKVVRTPGNRLLVQYSKKKVALPSTPKYLGGKPLQGLKRIRPARKATVSASAKKVSRPYGGVLSFDLVRERIIRAFLIEEQKIVKRVLKMKKVKEVAPVSEPAAETKQ
ncbi:ribosomal protein L34 [Acrasis kona]|uniref:Ribosomal protein L34 n=1 Tax=Acrasis kona TaxID=1008807 RepID=A0AAW2Z3A1_9EUKA